MAASNATLVRWWSKCQLRSARQTPRSFPLVRELSRTRFLGPLNVVVVHLTVWEVRIVELWYRATQTRRTALYIQPSKIQLLTYLCEWMEYTCLPGWTDFIETYYRDIILLNFGVCMYLSTLERLYHTFNDTEDLKENLLSVFQVWADLDDLDLSNNTIERKFQFSWHHKLTLRSSRSVEIGATPRTQCILYPGKACRKNLCTNCRLSQSVIVYC